MLLRGSSGLLPRARASSAAPCVRALRPTTGVVRTYASGDRSWADILSSAVDVAKDVANKVKDTVGQAIAPITKQQPNKPTPRQRAQQPAPRQRARQEPLAPMERPGLLGSLMGRAVGGMLASAVDTLGKQLEQAAAESQGVYENARSRIMSSAKLRSSMGEVQVGPIISQSSSSTYINGVSSKSVNLLFQVYGSSGQVAQAQVLSQGQDKSSQVTVQLPNGSIVRIENGGSKGYSGTSGSQVIDVEYQEVRK